MPNAGLVAAAVLAAVIAAWALWRLGRLHRRAERAEAEAAARGRALSLAAQELRGLGIALESAVASPAERAAPRPFPFRTSPVAPAESWAERLLRLSDDLAELAGPRAPRLPDEGPVALGPVMDAAVATVADQIRPALRHFQVTPALRGLTVRADPRALEGAVAALLRRAARHSRDGDAITLRHVLSAETLAIIVEDEGDGLAAADLAPTGHGAGTRGLDLGLSLARSLAAAHGGDVRLEAAPGIGARAWLTLPRERLLEPA